MNELKEEIGGRLKLVREKARMPQDEFAERLGISPRTYAGYERGERSLSIEALKTLYEEFSVDPIWLMTGPDPVPRLVHSGERIDLLVEIIVKVETRLAKARKTLPLEKKARLIALLYQYFQAKGEVEDDYIESAFSFSSL